MFDGIVVQTGDGARFVDASDVDGIFERCVITSLSLEQAKALPPPEHAPPVYGVDPAQGTGTSLRDSFPPLVREGALDRGASGARGTPRRRSRRRSARPARSASGIVVIPLHPSFDMPEHRLLHSVRLSRSALRSLDLRTCPVCRSSP